MLGILYTGNYPLDC